MKIFRTRFQLMITVSILFLFSSVAAAQNMAVTEENRDIPRFKQQCERMDQGKVDLLFVGDSITHFWENRGKKVWDEYYAHRNAMNFGISGDRTGHVLWRIKNSPMKKISPKMAVVMIGTNNIGHKSSSPEQTVEGIKMIIDALKTNYPKMKILLLEVFPRDFSAKGELRQKVDRINSGLRIIYQDQKTENVQLYGIGDLFLEPNGDLPKSIMPDALHPNEAGYRIWARAIEPMIREGLGETCGPASANNENRNKTNWLRERFESQSEQLKKENAQILFLGDSITHRWEKKSNRPGRKEYEHNGEEIWQKYFAKYNAINLGIDGDRTQHVLWRIKNYDFSRINPKLIVLLLGVNNTAAADFKAEDVAFGIRKICQLLHQKTPKTKVLLLKVFPCDIKFKDGRPRQPLVDALNSQIPYFVRDLNYVVVQEIGKIFQEADGSVPNDIMPDRIHLSTKGYLRWARAIDPFVSVVFAPEKK